MYRPVFLCGIEYQIDESGNIQKRRGQGHVVPSLDSDGYLRFRNKFIHRLVYSTWVGEIPEGMTVDHRDRDKSNNHYLNLRLLTAAENSIAGNARYWEVLSPSGEVLRVYNLKEFCRNNNLHKGHLYRVLKGDSPSHVSHKGWRKP